MTLKPSKPNAFCDQISATDLPQMPADPRCLSLSLSVPGTRWSMLPPLGYPEERTSVELLGLPLDSFHTGFSERLFSFCKDGVSELC